jgi:parvulin-like peptidyl-prolyl cis-trans isomerase-like protein
MDAITAGFARTWQRPPTEQEVKGLLDEYLREEIAAREAVALGLDRDDTVIRRRLRQKFEFAAEDAIDAAPPTDAELQAWLDAHPATFTQDAEVSFLQVFLNPQRRGNSIDDDARRLRDTLSQSGAQASIEAAGDSVMLPHDIPRSARTDVAQQFGEGFADALLTLPVRTWTGPIRSGYGLHLVYVRESRAGRLPALADIRPLVEREFTADRRRRHLDALYAAQLERYRIVIEKRSVTPGTAEAATLPGRSPQ